MKHVRTISRVQLSPAQSSATDIITILISVLTALGTVLGVIVPLFEDKTK